MTYKLCPNCGKRQFQRLSEHVYQCRACGCNAEQLTIPFPRKKRSSTKRSPKSTFIKLVMKELSNLKPNLPDTAYLLAYPQLRAVVPGCENLLQALDHSCIDRKPVLAFRYSDGWVMIAPEEIDRAWNELHISRTMAS